MIEKHEIGILMKAVGNVVRSYVTETLSPLVARVAAVEERWRARPAPEKGEKGEPGRDGTSVDVAEVRGWIQEIVAIAVAAMAKPNDGAPGEKGKDGKDGRDADPVIIAAAVNEALTKAVAALPRPKDGKDADPLATRELVSALVNAAVSTIPPAKDGTDGKDGRDGENGKDGAPGKDGLAGKDGVNGKDGKSGERGEKGVDGKDGRDGKDADEESFKRLLADLVAKAVSAIPAPRDGKDGASGKDVDYAAVRGIVFEVANQIIAALPKPKDGRDAAQLAPTLGIDVNRSYPTGSYARHAKGLWYAASDTQGMSGWECIMNGILSVKIEQDSERNFSVRATQSDGTEALTHFTMPVVLDKGVYSPGTEYAKGDGVTYAGSWWIAQVDKPTAVPGNPATAHEFRLAVKRGRDGKDAPARLETGDRPAGKVSLK